MSTEPSTPTGILVVEDDEVDAEAIQRELRSAFDGVPLIVVAQTLQAALQFLSENLYQAVLLDLSLPDSSGLGTAQEVLQAAYDTPVVILTGNNNEDQGVTAVSEGAQDYLCKDDLGKGILKRVVRHSIERHRLLGKWKQARSDLEAATTQEQMRIARELHDGISHLLTALGLQASNLKESLVGDDSPRISDAEQLVARIRQVSDELKTTVRGLAPPELAELGLSAALEKLTQQWQADTQIACRFQTQGQLQAYPASVVLHLYRITQEALHNAMRHAQAKVIQVTLQGDRSKLLLRVQDNGRGFDPKQQVVTTQSLGLRSMMQRALAVGGTLTINSQPGQGTVVLCRVPNAHIPKPVTRSQS